MSENQVCHTTGFVPSHEIVVRLCPEDMRKTGGPDATASGFRRNKRSFFTAVDHSQGCASGGVDALDLLSLRGPDV